VVVGIMEVAAVVGTREVAAEMVAGLVEVALGDQQVAWVEVVQAA
jgi:hypothetical protein